MRGEGDGKEGEKDKGRECRCVMVGPSIERLESKKHNHLVDDRKASKEIERKPRFAGSSPLRTG